MIRPGVFIVKKFLDLALGSDETKKRIIDKKAKNICSQIIKDGDKLVSTFQFDEAIETAKSIGIRRLD